MVSHTLCKWMSLSSLRQNTTLANDLNYTGWLAAFNAVITPSASWQLFQTGQQTRSYQSLTDTSICTDGWRSYNDIVRQGGQNYQHLVVNHCYNFIDPQNNEAHTHNIESMWSTVKAKYERRRNIFIRTYVNIFFVYISVSGYFWKSFTLRIWNVCISTINVMIPCTSPPKSIVNIVFSRKLKESH